MTKTFKELGITLGDVETESNLGKLHYYKRTVDFTIQDIKLKIERYHALYQETGVEGDFNWYHRARKKKIITGLFSEAIKMRIARLNRAEKEKRQLLFERAFMDVAKEQLTSRDFAILIAAAEERITDKTK